MYTKHVTITCSMYGEYAWLHWATSSLLHGQNELCRSKDQNTIDWRDRDRRPKSLVDARLRSTSSTINTSSVSESLSPKTSIQNPNLQRLFIRRQRKKYPRSVTPRHALPSPTQLTCSAHPRKPPSPILFFEVEVAFRCLTDLFPHLN